ncbi:hypothetical protein [Variovorax boronicumulans]
MKQKNSQASAIAIPPPAMGGRSETSSVPGRSLTVLRMIADDYPWKTAGFIAFLVGCGALYGYFVSIDYVPPDLMGTMALGSIAALWLFLIWSCMTIVLFGTAAVIAAYEVKALNWLTVFLGQWVSTLCLIASVFRKHDWWWLAAVVGAAAAAGTAYRMLHEKPRRPWGDLFMAAAAILLGGSFLPMGAYLAIDTTGVFRSPPDSWMDWRLIAFPVLLIGLMVANTFAVSAKARVSAVVVWFGCLLATAAVFLAFGGPAYVGTVVAERVGLRLPGLSTLSVSKETCTRVVAATQPKGDLESGGKMPSCDEVLNLIRAEVQLRWSGRWLLAVTEIKGIKVRVDAPRVTIPDDGTQLVLKSKSTSF